MTGFDVKKRSAGIKQMNMKLTKYIGSCIFILMLGSTACEEDCKCVPPPDDTYFVFGHFYGECVGEGCVEIFKIEGRQLFEDTRDIYPFGASPYAGEYIPLSEEKYQLVRDIVEEVPEELFQESGHIIGMPDGGDWGGIYVGVRTYSDLAGPIDHFWLLDQNENNMPAVYNAFVDKINEKIALIHE